MYSSGPHTDYVFELNYLIRKGLSMTKAFQIEIDTLLPGSDPHQCSLLEVELYIECRDSDGADSTYTIESIEHLDTGNLIELEALDKRDREKLERACQDMADEYAMDAAQEHREGMADWAYDRMKDMEMES